MGRILAFTLLVCVAILAAGACGKSDSGKDGMKEGKTTEVKKTALTKEKFMEYLKERLAIVETPEYGAVLAKYKAETKGVKDIMDRQKVWEKYFKEYQQKELDLLKKFGLSLSDTMDATRDLKDDKDVMQLVFKLANYAAF